MPDNEALAERVRRALAGTQGLTEKKMFGGIAFLVNGAMCVGVDRDDLIVRCEKDETEKLLAKEGVREFDLRWSANEGMAPGRSPSDRNHSRFPGVDRLRAVTRESVQ